MTNKPEKNKTIAALLAFFLGPLGIHQFYLGKNGNGVAYILGTMTLIGIFFTRIISIVEFIQLLTMSQESFDRKYNPHLYLRTDSPFGINAPLNQNINVADEIAKLDELFRKGVITFEEFERRKQRLLM